MNKEGEKLSGLSRKKCKKKVELWCSPLAHRLRREIDKNLIL